MFDLSDLSERNRQFAAQYEGKLNILPRFSTMILTCVDARVDPTYFLGLEPGDALVLRTAGARITPDVELEVGVLWALASRLSGDNFRGMGFAIVHHTDCGYERLANPEIQTMVSNKLGVGPEVIEALGISDHVQALQGDIEQLRRSTLVPDALVVSGYLFNLEDGLIQEVVTPAPLNSAG